jgi:type II secretory pathway component PulF
MPTYIADCISARGHTVRRRPEATNASAARAALRAAGYFPFAIREAGNRYRRTKVARRHLIALFHELAILLESQSLLQALDALRTRYPHRALRGMIREIHDSLASSRATAPDAFGAFGRTFTPEIVSLIAAGEAAGPAGLSARFADLEEHLTFEAENRGNFISAVSYPAGLAFAVFALLAFVFVFLVPKLQDLISTFNSEMPALTTAIFAIAAFVQKHPAGILVAIIAPILAVSALWLYAPSRLVIDTLLLRVPILGDILKNLLTGTVAKTYASLYDAARHAPEILLSCAASVSNRRAKRVLMLMHHRVALEGFSPDDAFESVGFWPPMVVMSIRNGAATGSLGKQMRFIARASSDAARRRSTEFFTVLRYAALLLMGGIVGLVVYGLLAPIMNLGMSIK